MKLTLTQVNRFTTDKQNNPLLFKSKRDGKMIPYTRVMIKTQDHGASILSGFGNRDNANWQVGQVIDVEVKEVQKDGKTYLNFEQVSPIQKLTTRVDLLEQRVNKLESDHQTLAMAPDKMIEEGEGLNSSLDNATPEEEEEIF